MKKVQLTEGAIQVVLHNSSCSAEYLLGLYKLVITDPWNEIESFNSSPIISRESAIWILNQGATKFDRVDLNFLWLQKGFSSDGKNLNFLEVNMPDDLYILTPKLIDNGERTVEELFNENEYDTEQSIKEDL